jgi:probable rRNA maturation factor
MIIRIHSPQTELKKYRLGIKRLAEWVCPRLKLNILSLDIIFVGDKKLQTLHRSFLQDDTPSDVITFNLSDKPEIEGEIYISLDRAREQAETYGVSLINEIYRLIIHGCLHLAGFTDTESSTRRIMKKKEEQLLHLAQNILTQLNVRDH